MESKALVAELLRKELGPKPEIVFEYRVQIRPGKYRIADVAVIYPSALVEIHEVQLAGITQSSMQERTDDYAEAGCPTQWWLGKSTADSYQLRDYLRSIQGGFYLLEFQEHVPETALHLIAGEGAGSQNGHAATAPNF
jgi:competence CoiA-like predicted nuclease